jgi:hypothetical protein
MLKKILLFFFLFLVAASIGSAIYKWIDSQGGIHYDQIPPSAPKASVIGVLPEPPTTLAQASAPTWQEQESAFQERRAARERAAAEAEETSRVEAMVQKNICIHARTNLDALERQRPVYTVNEKGERIYLSDAQLSRLRQEVLAFCPPDSVTLSAQNLR